MNRTRERGSLGRLFRGNIKTFLNDILRHVGMIPDSVDQILAGMHYSCDGSRNIIIMLRGLFSVLVKISQTFRN